MMTDENTYRRGAIHHLKPDDLLPDPEQPRKHFDRVALDELARSVRQHGVLQPVLFRVDENGHPRIVAGERRVRAARAAALEAVPALLVEGKAEEIALVENVMREDLSAMEEAEAMQSLIRKAGYTHAQLASMLGKGRSTITNTLSLTTLPEDVREAARKNPRLPRRELIRLVALRNPVDQRKRFRMLEKRVAEKEAEDPSQPRPRTSNSPAELVVNRMVEIGRRIQKLRALWDDVSPEERTLLATEAALLSKRLEPLLSREQ